MKLTERQLQFALVGYACLVYSAAAECRPPRSLIRSVTRQGAAACSGAGTYFRLTATFGKGAVTSRSSIAMMPSSARDTHRSTCQNITAMLAAMCRGQLYFGHCPTADVA